MSLRSGTSLPECEANLHVTPTGLYLRLYLYIQHLGLNLFIMPPRACLDGL
jgi:hypothetical protein